ncbi:MAG: hypothetical protein JHC33_00275 [Ignisphaera sp.]|nr:hypothetical protein [Ignisphaera sp.]
MSYILLSDAIEHLFKFKKLEQFILNTLKPRDRQTLVKIVEEGIKRGCLRIEGAEIVLQEPVELLILLEEMSIQVNYEQLARYIEWSSFEKYIAEKLRLFGLDYASGYRHDRISKFQIDVLALDSVRKIGFAIECKHWKRSIKESQLYQIVTEHLQRVEKLLKNCEWVASDIPLLRKVKYIVPVILTLYESEIKNVMNVPIISLRTFTEFFSNIDVYLDLLDAMKYENRCFSE